MTAGKPVGKTTKRLTKKPQHGIIQIKWGDQRPVNGPAWFKVVHGVVYRRTFHSLRYFALCPAEKVIDFITTPDKEQP